ncbi:twin-arginine translocase subunit TatC [Chloroflexota bacterium]
MEGVAATEKEKSGGKSLTFKGHLIELRKRLLWSVIAVVATTCISLVYARHIFNFFEDRAPDDIVFVQIGVTEMVGVYMKVCLYSGLVLALPFLLYQAVMFVNPALTRNEKRYLYTLMPGVMVFFLAGAAFAYWVFLPPALRFLLDFPLVDEGTAASMISIGNYISVIVKLLVAMGLIFQLPLVMYFLSKIGVISPQWLSKYRRFAFVGAFIIAAIVTPTFDPLNQTIVAVPIVILYELGILLSRLAVRKRPAGEGQT